MRPKLLKSFVSVTVFWFLATLLYWSFSDPEVNRQSLLSLKHLVPFLPFEVPDKASIFTSWRLQILVIAYWTGPLLLLTFVSFAVGYGLVWLRAHESAAARDAREKSTDNVRGMTVTKGELPGPAQLPRDDIELGGDEGGLLAKLSAAEKELLEQILGTLSAHPDAYAGAGHRGSLLELAMSVSERALATHRTHPGLAGCAAAAHELGKISAYKKNESGDWVLTKNEDREASRILTSLPAWWLLPQEARQALMLAVKYKSQPRLMPEFEGNLEQFKLAQDLLYTAKDVQEIVVQEEKKKTLDKHELPDVVFSAFKDAMPLMAFQNRGLPKGVRAVAWKFGRRVYMLEIALRESVTAKMDAAIVEALQPSGKTRQRLQPFTVELLKALDAAGWLVKENEGKRLSPTEAVWNIQAGKLEFRGVIIIDAPEDLMSALPSQDSMYEVKVTGPMFAGAAREDAPAPGLDKPTKNALAGVLDM